MTIHFPNTLGACIDELYNKRAERLELARQLDALKEIESAYTTHILNTFTKVELSGAKGDVATASIKRSTVYQLDNWDEFIGYVDENKAWELLRKQPGSTACRERFDAGESIPGITPVVKIDLSLTKVS